jgi:deazaflavin-dependent oxidoreductase (nitroreductase family)
MAKAAPQPWTPTQERVGSVVVKVMSVVNVWLYRATGGWLGSRFRYGAPVCLVTVIGRKSGRPLTVPLLYLQRGREVVLVASKGGMSHHPLWYHNMMANPRVEVEIGRDKQPMLVRRASDDEKRQLWPELVKMYPDYDDYQARTTRNIPVLILAPAS